MHLVVFGCGYVGSAVAERALADGMRVTALTRNSATAASLRRKGVKTVVGSLEADAWHADIRGVDFVLNSVSAADPSAAGYRRSYVDGGRSILRWAQRLARPVDTLVYTSSTGVYPQGGGVRVDESSPVAESSASTQLLIEAEKLFLGADPGSVGRAIVLRLAGIYGPGRHSILDQLRAGARTINGRGDHRLNLVHRDDIVAAVLAAFRAPREIGSEVFNLSEPPEFDTTAPSIRRGGAGVPDRIIDSSKARRLLKWEPLHRDFRSGYEKLAS
jgi:nucleoside-diphosphate-sugar epimerase